MYCTFKWTLWICELKKQFTLKTLHIAPLTHNNWKKSTLISLPDTVKLLRLIQIRGHGYKCHICISYHTNNKNMTSSPWTTIHRTALFCIHSDWVQTHTHTAIYLSSRINRWIYTDIHKYTFLICIFILKSCYVSVKDSPYWMRAHSDLKTHTQHSWTVGRIPIDLHVQ